MIEAKYFQNMEKARELWNSILSAGNSSQAHMWMAYYHLERLHGDSKHCRKILHRAVNAVSDWPEHVCETLVMFERLEGTLDTLQSARRRVETQMKRVQERREKERAAYGDGGGWRRQDDNRSRKRPAFKQRGGRGGGSDRWRGGEGEGSRDRGGQRRDYNRFVKAESSDQKDEDGMTHGKNWKRDRQPKGGQQEKEERKERKEGDEKMRKLKRKADSSDDSGDQSKKMKQEDTSIFKVPTALPPKSPKSPKSANFTPLGVSNKLPEEVQQQVADVEVKGEAMETEVFPATPKEEHKPDPDKETQEKTIFVKNLSYDIGEEKVKEIFSKCGEVQEIVQSAWQIERSQDGHVPIRGTQRAGICGV